MLAEQIASQKHVLSQVEGTLAKMSLGHFFDRLFINYYRERISFFVSENPSTESL